MKVIDLTNQKQSVIFGNDSVVIQKFNGGLKGGRALDTTGITETHINAGHVIITDGEGNYKPMPVSGEAYDSLPEDWKYAGVLYRTILTAKGDASIMFDGEVNIKAVPYPMDAILSAFKTALPNIIFVEDEPYVAED